MSTDRIQNFKIQLVGVFAKSRYSPLLLLTSSNLHSCIQFQFHETHFELNELLAQLGPENSSRLQLCPQNLFPNKINPVSCFAVYALSSIVVVPIYFHWRKTPSHCDCITKLFLIFRWANTDGGHYPLDCHYPLLHFVDAFCCCWCSDSFKSIVQLYHQTPPIL